MNVEAFYYRKTDSLIFAETINYFQYEKQKQQKGSGMFQVKVESNARKLKEILGGEKYIVDFYQREYVWEHKQIEDLVGDLSVEFLKNWKPGDTLWDTSNYDPYFMGEIVVSTSSGRSAIIDGQQRITSFILFLIYLIQNYAHIPKFPRSDIERLIYSDDYGTMKFNLEIPERNECLMSLYQTGSYTPQKADPQSVHNLVDRYNDIAECWNTGIDENNVVAFTYWLMYNVIFSKVETNSDNFAYVIFETMNDRGLSLTQVEMLRGYLLANIDETDRPASMVTFDNMTSKLATVKLSSNQKAESEFFKIYLRAHLADTMSAQKNSNSDYSRIGNEFHRWVCDNAVRLGLLSSDDFVVFIKRLAFYADVYVRINEIIVSKDTEAFLYLVVNNDYNFSMQPAPIIASVEYGDDDKTIDKKIKMVSKYLTKLLSWRVWCHQQISQSSLDALVFGILCKEVRNVSVDDLKDILDGEPLDLPSLATAPPPMLNQQNRNKMRVLLSLITEIVATNSGAGNYMLKQKKIEVEHIWADHYEQHLDEISGKSEFDIVRNNIGDLLVLPEKFNKSYNDDPYEEKVVHYIEQNILAQTLNSQKYENNPEFLAFKKKSGLDFKPYEHFTKDAIYERGNLYRNILLWNWGFDLIENTGMFDEDDDERDVESNSKNVTVSTSDQARYAMRFDYWTAFDDYAFKNEDYARQFKRFKAGVDHWHTVYRFPGRGVELNVKLLKVRSSVAIELYINDDKKLYDELFSHRTEIETTVGSKLSWQRLNDKKASRIQLEKPFPIENRDDWENEFEWAADNVLKFYWAFKWFL